MKIISFVLVGLAATSPPTRLASSLKHICEGMIIGLDNLTQAAEPKISKDRYKLHLNHSINEEP